MARTATPPTADEVREWARSIGWQDSRGREVSDRGRMSSELITEYNKKHRARPYEETGRQAASTPRNSTVATRESAPRKQRTTSVPASAIATTGHMEPSAGTNVGEQAATSLENVLSMFAAMPAGSKRGGRPTLVTVTAQTLEYV